MNAPENPPCAWCDKPSHIRQGRLSPSRTQAACERGSVAELRDSAWLQSALVKTQVVDVEDAAAFPEMALAREHARKLLEGKK